MTTIIGAYFLQPFHTESRQSATVRSNNDIIICCHNLQIPSIAPKLADRTLRSTFTEEKGRILLIRIEIGRINYPRKHIFSIHCLCPAWLNLTQVQLTENMVVFFSDTHHFCFFLQTYGKEFIGCAQRMALGKQLLIIQNSYRSIVVHTVCQLLYLTLKVCTMNHAGSMPYTGKIQSLSIRCPAIIVYSRLE